jgi:ABC-2 type transport system permease protein
MSSQTAQVEPSVGAAQSDTPWLTRVGAFFRKEINEIRRQPRLILSLVGGPLLVLGLFGAAFQSSNPQLRTGLVIPEGGVAGVDTARIRSLVELNFNLELVTSDRARAEELLRNNELDVVQVVPDSVGTALANGEAPKIEFLSNAIDPQLEGWVQYLAYAEVNEINREILKAQTAQAQGQAANLRGQLAEARVRIGTLEQDVGNVSRADAQQTLSQLRSLLDLAEGALPSAAVLGNANVERYREQLQQTRATVERIETALVSGQLQQNIDDLRRAQEQLGLLEGDIELFVSLSPDAVIAPVQRSYANVNPRQAAFSPVVYYAPGVVALLVQHTAVTLGALALVRERLIGALEVFRVAPVSLAQLLVGKYAAYTLFIVLVAAVLSGLLMLIGVPLLGNALLFIALIVLLTLASLGVGFLISTVSGSDSQAIQLSMITLLVSIFFSGLFIPLDSFWRPALAVSYILPMTHGVAGLQNVMLRGLAPTSWTWLALTLIAVATFALVLVLFQRQLRKA